ncbi:MAG: hypothetical protein RR136_04460, partial [Clostridia bacterium]
MQVVIDERVNKVIEEYFLNLNYEVIKINKDIKLYSEISSHTDINFFKLENNIYLNNNLKNIISVIPKKYNIYSDIDIFLNCIKLNICLIDKFAIHNFK